MKTFGEFQEAAAAVKAIPTIVKAFTKVAPMVAPKLKTFAKFSTAIPVGLSVLQARKKGKFQRKEMKGRVGDNQKIKPKLLDAVRKKQREILGKTDDKLNTPTDIVDFTGKNIDKKIKRRMNAPENQFNSYNPLDEEAPTNSVGGGQIAGTVEAGDDPPAKKKKRYIYGGRGSRKMWMNNK